MAAAAGYPFQSLIVSEGQCSSARKITIAESSRVLSLGVGLLLLIRVCERANSKPRKMPENRKTYFFCVPIFVVIIFPLYVDGRARVCAEKDRGSNKILLCSLWGVLHERKSGGTE